ncbi:hypothetical protein HFP15_39310 [Amycolatopsis sp. K13G38]|uniref:Uncharacterized protein n=1 Tax=Amycolatopsis acididurans TaxID=2724524 RepID=A0ABX1JJ70_9PSEU|nr:hypothetical protein [Amycolatopsis acididurans]NKQ58910.1 hypothetical protein [Amycolatopsis acididurans]
MDDNGIDDHPDLLDPDWRRHAEKEAWSELRATRRRRSRGRRIVIPLAVLVVVAGAGYGVYRWGKTTSDHYSAPAPAAGQSAATTTAAGPSDLPVWGKIDRDHPFTDTPAQNWAAGLAGLTTPPAAKVGEFSAKQVGDAIGRVKAAIAASALDTATLEHHDTAHYLSLFAPDDREQMRPELADTLKASSYVVFLADGYHLLPSAPRMNGSLTIKAGARGELVLHATYITAYAFDPGDTRVSGPADIVAFKRADEDYVLRTAGAFADTSAGLWVDNGTRYAYAIACDKAKQGFLAPGFADRGYTDVTQDSLEPGVFDPNQPPPTKEDC